MMNRIFALAAALCLSVQPAAPGLLAAAEAAAPDRATLRSVEVAEDAVSLVLDAQAKFNTFVTAEPPRLVIELLNTEHAAAVKSQEGKGAALKRVRSGQFQREPALITRIVLDLTGPAEYEAGWEGSKLAVRLKAASMASAAAAAPARDSVAAPEAAKAPAPAAPAPAPKKAAKKKAPAPAPKTIEEESSEEVRGMAQQDAAADVAPAKAPASAFVASGPERRDIMSSLPTEPVSLDFDAADIKDILKLLATRAGVNIIYGSDVSGSLSLNIANVPFNEAFTTILQMQGLVASQVGENILRVMTPITLQKEKTVAVNQTRVIPLKYSKAADVKASIDAVRSAEGRLGGVVVEPNINALIVTDTLDGIAAVERLLAQLDKRPQQVMIEAKLVEVKLTKDVNFGIQWDYLSVDQARIGKQLGQNLIGTVTNPATSGLVRPLETNANNVVGAGAAGRGTGVLLPASKIFGAFTFGRVTNNYFLSATLTAAAAQGKVKVLSDPKIATLSGKKANINITTQIPYVTSSVSATGVATQAVSYISTGIILDVTPTINADGRVTLEINPTVSQPSAVAATAGTTGAPAVDSRQAKTTVLVQDGETIVIGGLITDSVTNTVAKVPLLGDIPFLGWLFKKKTIDRTRVELLIFVTPKVIPS